MHCLAFVGDHLIGGGEEGSIEIWRLERSDNLRRVSLISLSDEYADGSDSGAMWRANIAGDCDVKAVHQGTTVGHNGRPDQTHTLLLSTSCIFLPRYLFLLWKEGPGRPWNVSDLSD